MSNGTTSITRLYGLVWGQNTLLLDRESPARDPLPAGWMAKVIRPAPWSPDGGQTRSVTLFDFLLGVDLVAAPHVVGGFQPKLRLEEAVPPDGRRAFISLLRRCAVVQTDRVGNAYTHEVLGAKFTEDDYREVVLTLGTGRVSRGRWDNEQGLFFGGDTLDLPEPMSWVIVSKGPVTVSTGPLNTRGSRSRIS